MIIILFLSLVIAILVATYFIINYNIVNDVLCSLLKDYKELSDENNALKIVINQYRRKIDDYENECCLSVHDKKLP